MAVAERLTTRGKRLLEQRLRLQSAPHIGCPPHAAAVRTHRPHVRHANQLPASRMPARSRGEHSHKNTAAVVATRGRRPACQSVSCRIIAPHGARRRVSSLVAHESISEHIAAHVHFIRGKGSSDSSQGQGCSRGAGVVVFTTPIFESFSVHLCHIASQRLRSRHSHSVRARSFTWGAARLVQSAKVVQQCAEPTNQRLSRKRPGRLATCL